MPSWPTRLLSGNSTPYSSSMPTGSPRTENSFQTLRQFDSDSVQSPMEISQSASLPQPPRFTSSPKSSRSAKRHGRSISNPFLPIFGTSRNFDRAAEAVVIGAGAVSLDDHKSSSEPPRDIHAMLVEKQYGEKDLITGKCATCDSLVRWPRHLDFYRCTVCLMINDLKLADKNRNLYCSKGSSSKVGITSELNTSRRVLPLSLDRTRSLIDHCIGRHLLDRIGQSTSSGTDGDDTVNEELNCALAPTRDVDDHDPLSVRNTKTGGSQHTSSSSPNDILVRRNQQPWRTDKSDGLTLPLPSSHVILGRSPLRKTSPSSPYTPSSRAHPVPPISRTSLAPLSHFETLDDEKSTSHKYIFKALEVYLIACLSDSECVNSSFSVLRPILPIRAASEGSSNAIHNLIQHDLAPGLENTLSEIDAKTLLIGNFAENGMWWTGHRVKQNSSQRDVVATKIPESTKDRACLNTPRIDLGELHQWYKTIIFCGYSWRERRAELKNDLTTEDILALDDLTGVEQQIWDEITEARTHVQRTLLKASENMLRRPGRPIKCPEDCRFLLILLFNPLLYPQESIPDHSSSHKIQDTMNRSQISPLQVRSSISKHGSQSIQKPTSSSSATSGKHTGIIKRIFGLMANLPKHCHQYLVKWFSRLAEAQFRKVVELVGGFVTYRLGRHKGRKRNGSQDPTRDLIPTLSGPGIGTSAQLHAALGIGRPSKRWEATESGNTYTDDWQIKASAKVMSLLFAANNNGCRQHVPSKVEAEAESAARKHAHRHGQILPISEFYNSLLDYADLISDFESWESRKGIFSFCQYPMFLSIWAKIKIMEHDTRRQMEVKAREAFFDSITSRKAVSQHLLLKVRRECLVEDSLRNVSEVVGTGEEEIKKGLRIEFLGEEGVDAGGLRKEWFLLLVREVFDPEHGLFVYDEDSQYCYFNPNSFETSDQFFLVGVVLGLAIYNSTILDVALPPFAFRKLLASSPAYTGPATSATRPLMGYTLGDLAEFKPSLAKGLQQLLDYEGNVEATFCRSFVVDVDRYGHLVHVPLCSNGENRQVTNSNRREFVDLYVQYILDTAVIRQYEPFKRGFFTVCAGNALSLFRPEEIELLVRGSDELLDVASLRAVAVYENWGSGLGPEDSTITWFWDIFISADIKYQRKILSFITGSDRIPAMGAMSLIIKVACLGENHERFPTARTCFNMLGLYKYQSKSELETRLWRAVLESEGFGLK